ncbi:thioesterase II family protein [Streptomyces sp. NBC_00564]|uniref:thioesterase II family protein n=1 Tax=Streptomyces sp. NBC_00564 TaxID=2903663 RepID=UPI00352E7F4B|nr:alpha/beta fold hydrolase [Streptomyces sp. NBC_00564]
MSGAGSRTGGPVGGRWIARPWASAEARLRMICFPHVGAGGAAFNGWLDALPEEAELCAVRLPGRENRMAEPLPEDWRTLLADLEEALLPLLDRPFVLVGHCSGSVLAYELARRLRDAGHGEPAMLVVSSTEAPALRRIDDPLHLLPARELLARVVEFGGMAEEVLDDPDLMAMFERILRADYRVIERLEYSAGPPLDVPITVVGGRRDPFVSHQAMAAWAAETTKEFSLHLLDAGHYVLNDASRTVADAVRRLLEGGTGR